MTAIVFADVKRECPKAHGFGENSQIFLDGRVPDLV